MNRNIGGIVTMTDAIRPKAQVAAAAYALVGLSINREKHQSALFMVSTGAVAGAPDTQAVDAKLQESADDSTWTDVAVSPQNPAVAIAQITAINTRRFLEVDLSGTKKFVRLAFTVAFTGGTTPAIDLGATAALGGGPVVPKVHA